MFIFNVSDILYPYNENGSSRRPAGGERLSCLSGQNTMPLDIELPLDIERALSNQLVVVHAVTVVSVGLFHFSTFY